MAANTQVRKKQIDCQQTPKQTTDGFTEHQTKATAPKVTGAKN